MKKIFVINGSASVHSANRQLIGRIKEITKDFFDLTIFNELKTLPHFDPEFSTKDTPASILYFRDQIAVADGVLICTPEYVFSIPAGLKNALEWCVSTTVFTGKPLGIITASASGIKAHEELQLIMNTLMAKFTSKTILLIQGIKGKINGEGQVTDPATSAGLSEFIQSFKKLTPEEP